MNRGEIEKVTAEEGRKTQPEGRARRAHLIASGQICMMGPLEDSLKIQVSAG